jgi:hypothetical protein
MPGLTKPPFKFGRSIFGWIPGLREGICIASGEFQVVVDKVITWIIYRNERLA